MIPASFGCISNCRFCPYPTSFDFAQEGDNSAKLITFHECCNRFKVEACDNLKCTPKDAWKLWHIA